MRLIVVVAALAACATGPRAKPGSCENSQVSARTIVFSAPDGTSPWVERLDNGGSVCADADVVGFNFHHVKLPDGKEGFVKVDDFR